MQHKSNVQTEAELVSDDSRYVYFRSNDVKPSSYVLYRYDRTTKAREVVFDQEGIWHIADHKPGKLLLEKEVGGNMSEFFEWDVAAKTLTPLFGQGEREEYAARYAAKDGELVVQTPRFGEFRRLYRYDVAKKDFSPVSKEIQHDVSGFSLDRKKTRIVYSINENGYTRVGALDARSYKEALPGPLAALKGEHVRFGAPTRDGRYWTFSVDGGQAPPTSYVYDFQTNKLTQWHAPSAPEMDTARFAAREREHYPARDGAKIPLFVRRPAEGARPAAVPRDRELPRRPRARRAPASTRAQLFVDAGFVFVEPNVRGSDATAARGCTPTTGRSGSTWSPTSRTPPRSSARSGRRAERRPRSASWAAATAATPR